MCGLAGIINSEVSVFDQHSFNILGVLNESRGKDSCGVFIDGLVFKGINKNKLFSDYTKSIPYPNTSTISILHDRATSPTMATNLTQCQPVVIYDDEGSIRFCMIHNGTLKNHTELAKKYIPDIDITGYSDSQILAEIIFRTGYDVLSEYTGTASICVIDYTEADPRVFFFSGNSCYNSKTEDYDVERQLYYIKQSHRFIFSSVAQALFLVDNNAIIERFPTNKLLQLINNELVEIKEYDRTNLKTAIVSYYSPRLYEDYDDDEVVYPYYYNNYSNTSSYKKVDYDLAKHVYKLGSEVLHGKYKIFESGFISTVIPSSAPEYAFFNGHLLISSKHFEFLEHFSTLLSPDIDFEELFPNICQYCYYEPFIKENTYFIINDELVCQEDNRDGYFTFFPTRFRKKDGKIYYNSNITEARDHLSTSLNRKLTIADLQSIILTNLSEL